MKRSEIRERLTALFAILPSLDPDADIGLIRSVMREIANLLDELDKTK